MNWDKNYFVVQVFSKTELAKYKKSAGRDLAIALSNPEIEVQFHFAYMALVKIGIYLIAKEGYRVKSRPGHHVKIIEALSDLCQSEEILLIGDKMRKDRNLDLYGGDSYYSQDETSVFLHKINDLYQSLD